MWSAFFLYFLIFSCFSEARKAVKRTPEVKFSYTELALILLLDFIGTVRVTFHAVSAKYFVLPARNISCWKAVIGVQRVTGKCFAKREMTNEGYFVNWWKMKSGKTTNVLYRCFC